MKLLKFLFFIALLLALAFTCLVSVAAASEIKEETVYQAMNIERVSYSLDPLKKSAELTKAAQAKANDMAKRGYFAHRSPQGKNLWDFIFRTTARPSVAGENLAVGFTATEPLDAAWMNSPTHRANVLDRGYSETGIGIAMGKFNGKQMVFVVQMFGQYE